MNNKPAIVFPFAALPLIESLMVELAKNCSKRKDCLCGNSWVFTDDAVASLRTLLVLECVDGGYSLSTLADVISGYDFDFCESVELI